MRKIIISFIAMLLALYGTVASGSYPMKEEVPAPLSQGRADTLLQFTSGGHVRALPRTGSIWQAWAMP